jgi:hypothetical protein
VQQVVPDGAGDGAGQGAGAGCGADGPDGPDGSRRTALAPGARIAGALGCVVLLGIEIAWSVRDLRAVGFHDTLWRRLQLDQPGRTHGPLVTSAFDLVLVVLLVGALVAARRSGAAGAFAVFARRRRPGRSPWPSACSSLSPAWS